MSSLEESILKCLSLPLRRYVEGPAEGPEEGAEGAGAAVAAQMSLAWKQF